jgi:general secretion pathway protein E
MEPMSMHASISTTAVTSDDLDRAIAKLRQTTPSDGSLWLSLSETLHIGDDELRRILLDLHGIAILDDEQWSRTQRAGGQRLANIERVCIRVSFDENVLLLSEDPWSSEATSILAKTTETGTHLALARPGQTASLLKGQKSANPAHQDVKKIGSAGHLSPVVEFVDQAISKAYDEGASDIHFEKDRQGVGIKYRLDGVMSPGERLDDPQRAEEVISRIKVLAQLDITERRRPQDGRIHWEKQEGVSLDLRVSIMPSIFGEDAVLRLLDKAQLRHTEESMSLDVLGFDGPVAGIIRGLATRPHGMLLVTGPTGSGKTTTVYAALTEANDGLEKIVTIEDPVEYELPGVLQIPVNEQKGLTFATGLRSILRHDPDKILVGEIRDAETAEIAIQSSLTGHLVFTTVHANSLFDVLGRFQHFGIDPFALASALNGIVVQRLLRKLCAHCTGWRQPTELEHEKLAALGLSVPNRLPMAQGCEHCRQTGYRGRFVVAEVHELNDRMRDLIVQKTSMSELKNLVYSDASNRLLARALKRVAQGKTTLEEVARVVGLV